jgi:putative ABC transport system permease protein
MRSPAETKLKPPRFAAWFLSRLLDPFVRDQALGDLEERFRFEARERGRLRARTWYRIQIGPVLKSYVENTLFWEASMFKSYLKTGWRNMKRQKGYSVINISGLALGMACSILIVFYIHHELSFDRFHENSERIFRVVVDATLSQSHVVVPAAQMPFGPTLARDYPEVAAAVRVRELPKTLVRNGDRSFYERGLLYADASFFEVFTFPLLSGDPRTALARAKTIVLTERAAERYFRGENPIGRALRFNDEAEYAVTGVMRDVPSQSQLQFDGLVSLETLFQADPELSQDWLNINIPTYLMFRDRRGPDQVAPKVVSLVEQRLGEMLKGLGARLSYSFQPLSKVHLHSRFPLDLVANNSDIRYVTLFAAIALFILGIACINFMNLATARSGRRAREIGLRKVVGADRRDLIAQFLGEATTHSLLSLGGALVLVRLILPLFRSLSGLDLRIGASQLVWLAPTFFGLALFVSLVAGSYPAVYLSAFQPAKTLKGSWQAGPAGSRFRQVLVVAQFLIGISLIIGTGVVRRQVDFMRNRDLGFAKDQVLVTRLENEPGLPEAEAIKARLKQVPGVVSAAMTQAVPGQSTNLNVQPFVPEGFSETEPLLLRQFRADADLVPTLGLDVVRGRNFSKDFPTDADAVLITEATARKLGWADPIGRKIKTPLFGEVRWREKTVIGVLRDFHFLGLRQTIEPFLLELGTREHQVVIKMKTERVSATVRELQRAWEAIEPGRPLDFFFLDGFFDAQYRAEERLGGIFAVFSGLAVVIACLGLFGLASFMSEQRAKEIAIRKVLGASVGGVLTRLSLEFLKLVGLAALLACPVAYLALDAWLRSFAYRSAMSPGTFLAAGAAALIIAFMTVAAQTFRAACSDPVAALKNE